MVSSVRSQARGDAAGFSSGRPFRWAEAGPPATSRRRVGGVEMFEDRLPSGFAVAYFLDEREPGAGPIARRASSRLAMVRSRSGCQGLGYQRPLAPCGRLFGVGCRGGRGCDLPAGGVLGRSGRGCGRRGRMESQPGSDGVVVAHWIAPEQSRTRSTSRLTAITTR
jgi:hypothetical protein